VKEERGGGSTGPIRGLGRSGEERWGFGWAGGGTRGSSPFLFFPISFLFSFPKPFPNSILKAQFISNQEQSTQNKICIGMNAQNHVTKPMINFNFPKNYLNAKFKCSQKYLIKSN
jgi:hypothetical protein